METGKTKVVVLTEKIYLDKIIYPTEDWRIFDKLFKMLQDGCINASAKCISICNIYKSYEINRDKDAAEKFLTDEYNGRKLQNICYDIARNNCIELYSKNAGSIGREVYNKYFKGKNSYSKKIDNGKGNPPMTYTESLPIPLTKQYSKIIRADGRSARDFNFEFPFLSKDGKKMYYDKFGTKLNDGKIKFSTNAKDNRTYTILENICNGYYQICDSKIKKIKSTKKVKNKNGQKVNKSEYVLLLSYMKPVISIKDLDDNKVLGIDLGMVRPIVWSVNFDDEIWGTIGADTIIKNNVKQEKINRRIQRNITYNGRDGHGRRNKLNGYDGKGHIIKNRNHTINQQMAKKVVSIAIKYGCGTIQLEDLSKIKDNNRKDRFLANWTYYELQECIALEATEYGIIVRKINPYKTSQTCSCCGEIGKRISQSEFICKNSQCKKFNKIVNADFNASRNISLSIDYTK